MPKLYQQLIDSAKTNVAVKTYSFLTITFILITVLVFFAIRPTIITIFEINEKTKELDGTYSQLKSKNEALDGIKKQMSILEPSGVKGAVDFFRTETFPSIDDSLYFAANIDSIAKASNVILTNFTSSKANDKQLADLKVPASSQLTLKNVNIAVDAKSLNDIKTFTDFLVGYARANRISSLNVKRNDVASKYLYSASITTYIFYQDSKSALNLTLPTK